MRLTILEKSFEQDTNMSPPRISGGQNSLEFDLYVKGWNASLNSTSDNTQITPCKECKWFKMNNCVLEVGNHCIYLAEDYFAQRNL